MQTSSINRDTEIGRIAPPAVSGPGDGGPLGLSDAEAAGLALAIDDAEVSGTRYPIPQMASLGI